MNRRDFLKAFGGTLATAAIAPELLAAATRIEPSSPAGKTPGFVVIEPGDNLQQAIEGLPNEGGIVYIRSGTYIVGESVEIPGNVRLIAEGSFAMAACRVRPAARPSDDAPITVLLGENDHLGIAGCDFQCQEQRVGQVLISVPIGEEQETVRQVVRRLFLRLKQAVG